MSVTGDVGQRGQFQHRSEFDSVYDPLAQFIASSHVPVTSTLLYSQKEVHRKTLFGTASRNLLSPAAEPSHSGRRSEEGDVSEGIPEALKLARREEIDAVGGQTMFAIGSLVKPLVALLCCIIIETKIYENFNWDTRVYTLLRKLYGKNTLFREIAERDEPTVKDLLLHHQKALPDLDYFLLLADGTFQVNDEEFLQNIDRVMNDLDAYQKRKKEPLGSYQYSNANTILLTLLLVKMSRSTINGIMDKYLFTPLDMHRTTLDSKTFNQMANTLPTNVARGCRISSGLEVCSLAPKHNYMGSNISAVMVGGWSCVDDLAKLYIAVCEALDQEVTGHNRNNPITKDMANIFLQSRFRIVENDFSQIRISFAGLIYDTRDPTKGMESLNYVVQQLKESKQQMSRPKDQNSKSGDESSLYYKGGTLDGFTASIYFYRELRTFAIVLSNAAGPVDVTEPAARYLIEASMHIQMEIGMGHLVRNFQSQFQNYFSPACELWRDLEDEDANLADWTGNLEPYVGTYKHQSHGLELEVTRDGKANFKRGRELLTTMNIRALNGKLRLFSVTEGVFIDRLTTFRDTILRIEHEPKIILWTNKDKERYIKQ